MKTDSFFYRFFSEFPAAFFALIGEDEQKAQHYNFSSVEVKQQSFRFDGIFLPEKNDDHIYFVEVQFNKDVDFYSRFFTEIFLYLRQYHPINDWRAVVLFPKESLDSGVHRHYHEFFESGRLQRVYLDKLSAAYTEKFPLSLLQIITESEETVGRTVSEIVKRLPTEIRGTQESEKIIELLIDVLLNKLPSLGREEIEKMVEPLISNIKKSRFYQEIAEEVAQEITSKIAQESKLERNREIAKTLLDKKMGIDFISEVTGLSKEEVLAISKDLTDRKN
jgi:predicted transposase/invertase (TIGR01784 family)